MAERMETEREVWRRETVQRAHRLKDLEEDYEAARSAAKDEAELRRLTEEMHRARKAHREVAVDRGARSPGLGFSMRMHQMMWARWLEIADEHARQALMANEALENGRTDLLLSEFRASMITTTASAATIEALYEDVRYLIEPRRDRSSAWKIADGLAVAFGLSTHHRQWLGDQLVDLFDRRNETLHGYAEPTPPAEHPRGFKTGAEFSRFNGRRSMDDLDLALKVLSYAEAPPAPPNRWVERWVKERSAYHLQVVAPIRARAEGGPAGG